MIEGRVGNNSINKKTTVSGKNSQLSAESKK